MQKAREGAANVAASAKSGMEKTKAILEEKGERMTTRDPLKKEMAERKKEERFQEAELEQQEMRDRNAPGRRAEEYGHTTGAVGSQYPVGTETVSGRTGVLDPDRGEDPLRDRDDRAGVQDPRVGGGARTGYGAGSTY